jgi:membrane-associated phospholipid phosphatase
MRIDLPIVLRRSRIPRFYPAFWLPYIVVYQVINRFPLFEPQTLPMLLVDRSTPFIPGLLPLYIAYIPFFWWTAGRSEDDRTLSRFFYATHLQLLLCSLVWVSFPVTMPRALFYDANAYNWADAFWRWFDGPNNCFPSLHAANCFLFIYFNWNRSWRWPTTLFALAIILSTILVKQHYVVDAFAGFIVYAISVALLRNVSLVDVEPERSPFRLDAEAGGTVST